MSLRKNRYNRLKEEVDDENDSKYDDSFKKIQFQGKLDDEIPWKGILLAFSLTVIGLAFLIFTFMSYRTKDTSDGFPFPSFILGCIAFVPGSYHLWVAYQAYKGTPGYHYEDIPNFD